MAQNIHQSFPRPIPSVLSATEGWAFTSLEDGAGAYPGVATGEQNQGFHSAIEIIFSCSTASELKTKCFDHPAHLAAARAIDPLIEDAWAMDWLEDRDALLVPSDAVPVMKHICFFQFRPVNTTLLPGTTELNRNLLTLQCQGTAAVLLSGAQRWAYSYCCYDSEQWF
jgi:hypothetical protein